MIGSEPGIRIKVCGITRVEDALLASRLGAWAIGFIFFEGSPRFVTPTEARNVVKALEGRNTRSVGVFVNSGIDQIREVVERAGIGMVQLHGDETPDFCWELRRSLPDVRIIKALRPRNAGELADVDRFATPCDVILMDTFDRALRGGTGRVGDWKLSRAARSRAPILLSGGITPENVRSAIEKVQPLAVDVGSGVEEAPGRKSPERLQALFRNANRKEP